MPPVGRLAENNPVPELTALPRPLYIRAFPIDREVTVDLHAHPWAQLLHITSGSLTLHTPDRHWLVTPASAVWLPPGEIHGITTHGPVAIHSLYLDATLVQGMPAQPVTLLMNEILTVLLREASNWPVDYDVSGAAGRMVAVIADQIAALPQVPVVLPWPQDGRLLRIVDWLQAHPDDARPLADWAVEVGATRRTLTRLFRQETGLAFIYWRQQLRLQMALPRLQAGEPIGNIAADLGYTASSFSHVFRQVFGKSPMAFNQSMY
jgi:AraC-like DNA-binding protein